MHLKDAFFFLRGHMTLFITSYDAIEWTEFILPFYWKCILWKKTLPNNKHIFTPLFVFVRVTLVCVSVMLDNR